MILVILVLTLVSPAPLSTAQTAEIEKVEKRLLAPCCYTQSIAEHGSDIAVQMRGEVTAMVSDGKSEKEIVDHYKNIYGDRILIVPDGLTGKILFSLPAVISVLGCLVLFLCLRRMLHAGRHQRASGVPEPKRVLSDALKDQIQREIGDPL